MFHTQSRVAPDRQASSAVNGYERAYSQPAESRMPATVQTRRSWIPWRADSSVGIAFGVTWRTLTNVSAYAAVKRCLKLPLIAELVQYNPRIRWKYVTRHYLAHALTVRQRAACFAHHYSTLHRVLPKRALRQFLHWSLPLLEMADGEDRFLISLGRSRPFDKEGEATLNLMINGDIVFVLCFTIVPGEVIGTAERDALLVTRLQGMPGCFDAIRRATRALADVAPGPLLMAALQGVAEALKIAQIAGVSAARHIAFAPECADALESAYDSFFIDLGLARTPSGLFVSSIPIPDKPVDKIKRGHKIRTRKKRALKQQIQQLCMQSMQRTMEAQAGTQLSVMDLLGSATDPLSAPPGELDGTE